MLSKSIELAKIHPRKKDQTKHVKPIITTGRG